MGRQSPHPKIQPGSCMDHAHCSILSRTIGLFEVSMCRHLEAGLGAEVLLPALNFCGGGCWHGEATQHLSISALGADGPQRAAFMGIDCSLCAEGTIRKQTMSIHPAAGPSVSLQNKKSPGLVVMATAPVATSVNRVRRNAVEGPPRPCNTSEWSEAEMLKTGRGQGGDEGGNTREAVDASFLPASRQM